MLGCGQISIMLRTRRHGAQDSAGLASEATPSQIRWVSLRRIMPDAPECVSCSDLSTFSPVPLRDDRHLPCALGGLPVRRYRSSVGVADDISITLARAEATQTYAYR